MSLLTELFPRVRAEVLRLLFADPAVELHFRDLVRQSGLTVGTLQTELAKLSALGLVTSERDGNRLYYRANSAHPTYPELNALVVEGLGLGRRSRRKRNAAALPPAVGPVAAGGLPAETALTRKAGTGPSVLVIGQPEVD